MAQPGRRSSGQPGGEFAHRGFGFGKRGAGVDHMVGARAFVRVGRLERENARELLRRHARARQHPRALHFGWGRNDHHRVDLRVAAFLSDKPRFQEIAEALLAFIGDSPLIAHNAAFDFGFLNAELAICERDAVCLTRMIDTVAIARKRHPGAKLSLDALCTRYGVDRSHRVKHGALLDAELLAQVYVELTGGRQIGLELAAETAGAQVIAMPRRAAVDRTHRSPRPHAASAEELARHLAFIGRMNSPLWGS